MDRARLIALLGVVLSFLFALVLLKYAGQRMGKSKDYTSVLLSKSVIDGAKIDELEKAVGSRVVVKDLIRKVRLNDDGSAEVLLTNSILYLPLETVRYLRSKGIDLRNCVNHKIYALVRVEKGKEFELFLVRPKAIKIK